MQLADKSKRALNFLIDTGIIYCFYYLFSIVGMILMPEKTMNKQWGLWYGFFTFVYFIFFESTLQKTPGKMISKTIVVNIDGTRPGFGRIVLRTIVRFSPFDFLSYMFGIGKGQHDYFSKTVVVDEVTIKLT
jgi:uncharacterized RDD family membrane protein YckC